MNDFDFDKSFSDDLRRERFEEPADQNWERLAASLDRLDRQRAWRKRLLFGGLPLLVATSLAVFFSSKWQAADRRADLLETRVGELERQVFSKENGGLTERQATVFSKKETPSQQVFSDEKAATANEPATDFSEKEAAKQVILTVEKATTTNELATGFSKKEAAESLNLTTEKADLTNLFPAEIQKAATTKSIEELVELPPKSLKPMKFLRKMIFQPVSKLVEKPVRPLKTPRFAAGLTGGLVASDGHESWPGEGWSGGLGAHFLLRKGWRLTGGIEWSRAEYESRFGGFPDVPPPPNAGDEFHRAAHSQEETTVLLGVRRQFRVEKRLQPFVSLAWAGVQPIESETEFQFINPVSGQRSSIKLPSEDSSHFDAANLRLGFGGSWKLRPRLELGLQTGWQKSFEHKKSSQSDGQFSATASLFRLF